MKHNKLEGHQINVPAKRILRRVLILGFSLMLVFSMGAPLALASGDHLNVAVKHIYLDTKDEAASTDIEAITVLPGDTRDLSVLYAVQKAGITYSVSEVTVERTPRPSAICVVHQDLGGLILEEEWHIVNPGNYGPYRYKAFDGYIYIGLSPESAAPEGVIGPGETKRIVFRYFTTPMIMSSSLSESNGELPGKTLIKDQGIGPITSEMETKPKVLADNVDLNNPLYIFEKEYYQYIVNIYYAPSDTAPASTPVKEVPTMTKEEPQASEDKEDPQASKEDPTTLKEDPSTAKEPEEGGPRTGDAGMRIFPILMIVSIAGLIAIAMPKRKKKH